MISRGVLIFLFLWSNKQEKISESLPDIIPYPGWGIYNSPLWGVRLAVAQRKRTEGGCEHNAVVSL